MKRWFVCLPILLLSITANAGWNQEKFCKDSMKGNAEYAQWGFQLRVEMFQKCGKSPSQSCRKKYSGLILRQGENARASVDRAYAGVPDTNYAFRESVMRVENQTLQALWAFTARPKETVKSIVELAYDTCIDTRMKEPDPIERTAPRYSRPIPPPPSMMPMEPSISSRLSTMQPEMSGGSPFGSCNNYNYLGPNGRAVYCQQCCYGDGNCQTICN